MDSENPIPGAATGDPLHNKAFRSHNLLLARQRATQRATRRTQRSPISHAFRLANYKANFSKSIVVAFIEEIEKAHQIILFRTYLSSECDIKHGSDKDRIAYMLTLENERTKRFNLIEETDICNSVMVYMKELDLKHREYPKFIIHEADKEFVKNMSLHASWNPVYRLLFRARDEGYILDEKPEAELEKLDRSTKYFTKYFMERLGRWEPPVEVEVEARTVIASNIPLSYGEISLRKLFRSSGTITYFKIERTSESQTAHITYKTLSDAKFSLKYTISLCWPTPLLVKLKTDQGVEPVVKKVKDVSILYLEALEKYNAIRS